MAQQKNYVSLKDESVRMFNNPLLEWFSHIHWTFPLIVWVPIMSYCLYLAFYQYHIPVLQGVLYFLLGLFLWTITEYFMHRFVFHYHPTSKFGQRIHFVMHGVHHDYPNDSKRLVMPPVMSLLISIPFFALFYFVFGGGGATYAAFSGIVMGYLCYDMLHYATHYAKWNNKYFVRLKKHHMAHHYVQPEAGFGVSSMFWDKVFHTEIVVNK